MSKASTFTKDQPQDGEIVRHPAHWFKFDGSISFQRPDGSHGEAEWFAACEPCLIKHGEKAATCVRGDAVWTGDEPVIEKVEN